MAAGLGFKTFTTGEVLTAADTNGYLMQGVLVFASAAARDAAITSPQEGQCCYLKDTDAVLTYSGAAWVGFDDSNAIQNSIVDAKGDLVAASGADTPARLAVGSNGETIVADSAATTGLRYQAPLYAGKNILINGAFDIWQRGTTFAATPATFAYLADRWFWIGATASVAQETTIVPTGFQYSMKATATGTTQPVFGQTVETKNCYQLAGKTVTLSAWMATSTAANVTLRIDYSTAVDNPTGGTWTTITSTAGSNDVSSTATMTRKSLSFVIPANALSLRILFLTAANVASGATFTITGCQLEEAAGVSAFARNGATIQGELAACQRYYFRTTASASYPYVRFGMGTATATTSCALQIQLPVTMRSTVTTLGSFGLALYNSGVTAVTSLAADQLIGQSIAIIAGVASGLTTNGAYQLIANNQATAYLEIGAEL